MIKSIFCLLLDRHLTRKGWGGGGSFKVGGFCSLNDVQPRLSVSVWGGGGGLYTG